VSEPPLVEGEVAPELAEEWPGLRIASMTFGFLPGKSPPELRDRLRLLSDRFRGPQAIALRQQPIPQAYRIFFRHVGLEPDERRVPVEALALERLQHGGFRSRNLLDDAITIAVMETGVPVWALDAAAVEGVLRLRAAEPGEEVPRGRLVVACATRPLAVLFDDPAPDAGVTQRTREMVLFSVAVPGVPPIHVEEALWTVWDIVSSD
jgi:DNA/RNA-binding domain of Phe-tRNA-synthetase-like protein